MTRRILATIFLLFSVLFLPFWFSVILAIFEMFYFRKFYEAVIIFLISDALFGIENIGQQNSKYFLSFFVSLFFVLILEKTKKYLKFYR